MKLKESEKFSHCTVTNVGIQNWVCLTLGRGSVHFPYLLMLLDH